MRILFHSLKKKALLKNVYFIIMNLALTTAAYAQGQGIIKDPNQFDNPVKSETFGDLIVKLAKIVTLVSIPIVVFFLILAGFWFVTAQGNEQQVSKAKGILFYTVIGVAVIVGAWAIAVMIKNFGQSL